MSGGALAWVLALAPLVGVGWAAAGTPVVVVLAAVLPALAYAAAVVWSARGWTVRPGAPAAAFALAWGAGVAAPVSGAVNDLLIPHAHGMLVPVLAAPLVEELAKGAVLVLLVLRWPGEGRGVRAGIVAGALVGVGFAAAENLRYLLLAAVQGGSAGLLRGVWVRGIVEGGVHAVFAAATGAGIGALRAGAGRRLGAVAAGTGAAVVQHVGWNGVASGAVTQVLCGAPVPDGPCRLSPDPFALAVTIPLVVAAALGPGALALAALARRRG